ncbi:MAG: BT_3928 family protein [Bacteroidales bacterium]
MRIILIVSRFILGTLFIFSGFVKAIDPLGSAYKFSDYFHAFGLEFLDGLSLLLAIVLSAFELVLGIVLILGYQKRITYWIVLFFMGFFTILTFILALTNPVTDCGCFGDALILTNWQTFFKNLVLMVFVLILFRARKNADNVLFAPLEIMLILLFFTGSVLLSVNSLWHLPALDFRPYDTGTHIPDEMKIPEGASADEYSTILLYKNLETGEVEEFTIENYPQDTSKYDFVNSESKLVKKGFEPAITDFGIMDQDGMDLTDEILTDPGYTLMMISHDLASADHEILVQGNLWSQLEKFAADFRFVPITASSSDLIEEVSMLEGLEFEFYAGDEIMLKTMIRSNPGFMMVKNGTIVAKWASGDFPEFSVWNNQWQDLISRYNEEQDPEIRMLIEEGYMEDLSWEMIDFDQAANSMITGWYAKRYNRSVWKIFLLSVLLLLIIPQFLPGKKMNRRG